VLRADQLAAEAAGELFDRSGREQLLRHFVAFPRE
jgi:hypothetical protein